MNDARDAVSPGWRFYGFLSVWCMLLYLAIVLPLDAWIPAINDWKVAAVSLLISAVLVEILLRKAVLRPPGGRERLQNLTLLSGITLISLLGMDVAFTVYSNAHPDFRLDPDNLFAERQQDPALWDGELMPEMYNPTDANFWVYKPGQLKVGTSFGEHYYKELSRHSILSNAVLESRTVDFRIDEFGFRNDSGPDNVRYFSLGDSFSFGYHMGQKEMFSSILEGKIGERIYNMGVSGSSPFQQWLTLRHYLDTFPDRFKPQHVLWLIFEGNDLEESYTDVRPEAGSGTSLTALFDGTIVGAVALAPAVLREQSVLRLLTGGAIQLNRGPGASESASHFQVDGKAIAHPLYHSPQFGYRLFRQAYIDRASQDEEYVLKHPNLPALRKTFDNMASLAKEHGFRVTVVTVPSDVRLYRHAYEGLPPVPDVPYFLREVGKMAEASRFEHVALEQLLEPYAKSEMIHFRDDTHWNARGHEIFAELLIKQVYEPLGAAPDQRAGSANTDR